jgi:hypothetical protein
MIDMSATKPRKRLLMVGAGRRVQNNFLPALRCLEDSFEVVGVHSRTAERLRQVTARWDVPAVESLSDVDFSNIDVVAISVPTSQNAVVLNQLLPHASRLHVVIDTPIAWNFAEYAASGPLLKQFAQVTVTEDYMNFPTFALLRKAVQDGIVGRPLNMTLYNTGYLYHGLALIRSFVGFGPVLQSSRQALGSYGVITDYRLHDDFKATVVGPYRQHTTGGLVFEGEEGVISEFPADQRFYGGNKPLFMLKPVMEAGQLVKCAITGNGRDYEMDLPNLRAMRNMDFSDKSDLNLLWGCGLIEVFRSVHQDRNLNRRYGFKNAFYDSFVSRRAEQGVVPIDPFRTFPSADAGRQQNSVWRANTSTFIKTSMRPASDLQPEEKVAVEAGSTLVAEAEEWQGDHVLLLSALLDGAPLSNPVSFIYPPAWSR